MKSTKEIAEFMLNTFKVANIKNNGIISYMCLCDKIYTGLNAREQDLAYILIYVLCDKGYIQLDYQGDQYPTFVRLLDRGYDYVYYGDGELDLSVTIKITPEGEDVSSNEIFNTMWAWIGKEHAPVYLTGSKLYEMMLSVDKTLPPSYGIYMDELREKGKSTTRRDWVYDFWKRISKGQKEKFFKLVEQKINQALSEQKDAQGSVDSSDDITDASTPSTDHIDNPIVPSIEKETTQQEEKHHSVFISYSWDDEEHKKWVRMLADKLTSNGVMVYFDQYDLDLGKDIAYFAENSISKADYTLLIGTPKFKEKTEKRKKGAGYEYSIISAYIMKEMNTNQFIPILREGSWENSFPTLLQVRRGLDMREDKNLDNELENLLREIYGQPKIKRPRLGKRPNFD